MSAMNVINATEGLLNGLAGALAASHHRALPYVQSGRAIRAIDGLVEELEIERATVIALQSENNQLRALAEDLMAQVLRLQSEVLELQRNQGHR
jgi:hypothetical protein